MNYLDLPASSGGPLPAAALCGEKVTHCLCTVYFVNVSGTQALELNVCDFLFAPEPHAAQCGVVSATIVQVGVYGLGMSS